MDQAFSQIPEFVKMGKLLKGSDVARVLNISRSFSYHLLQTGAIPTVRLGKAYRVRPQDLDAYIQQNLHIPSEDN
jgi:excisionase family DNA binding protein